MRLLVVFQLVLLFSAVYAQQVVTVTVLPTLNGLPIEPETTILAGKDTIFIEKLQFYLSGISVSNASQTFSYGEPAKLIVAGADNRFNISTAEGFTPTGLTFVFGTDSTMNCSGIMGGDLDPALGMYWAWQSGYINFKLEGTSSSMGENKSFQLHLGGYKRPFETARKVVLQAVGNNIIAELPLDELFAEIRKNGAQTVMRPCEKGSELCTFIAGNFRLK